MSKVVHNQQRFLVLFSQLHMTANNIRSS